VHQRRRRGRRRRRRRVRHVRRRHRPPRVVELAWCDDKIRGRSVSVWRAKMARTRTNSTACRYELDGDRHPRHAQ
jgi:hypothetical protein